MLIFEDKVRKY